MKSLLKMSFRKFILFTLIVANLIAPVFVCRADVGDGSAADLDFGTNIETPKVPAKVAHDIREHMQNIRKALEKHKLVVETERSGEVVNIKIPCSVFFAANDTVLKPASLDKLRLLSDVLKYPTMYKVIVAVYSDNTGDDEYNDHLTMTRANIIDDFLYCLVPDGVEANIVPYGMGSVDPRVENNSITNRDLNRRVEIRIVPEWQMIETARAGKLKSKR